MTIQDEDTQRTGKPHCSILSARIRKRNVLGTLGLIADEPDYYSELFGYNEFADRVFELLSYSLPDKPFAICLDGKWGQGKTSLLMRIHNKILSDSKVTKSKSIWFDAWKNEDIDPTVALLLKILGKYSYSDERDSFESVQRIVNDLTAWQGEEGAENGLGPLSLHQKRVMDDRETLPEKLDQLIGSNNKLYVFIDDLDRCEIHYIKKMLKAITTFLKANNIKFIVAADLGRLHALLQPKSRESSQGDGENRFSGSFFDKTFQLKLVLPEKDGSMMKSYVDSIAGRFPAEIHDFLAAALPRNPRKAKEALNLAFYVSELVGVEEYEKLFPYILIWSILATSFHNLASIIHKRPETLFEMTLIASQTNNFSKFVEVLDLSGSDDLLFFINLKLPKDAISPLAKKLSYSHVLHDVDLYNYLKAVKDGLELDFYSKKAQIQSITKAINYVGLIS